MHSTESGNSKISVVTGPRRASLVQIGGSLGIAAVCIALLVFLVALFGFYAVFMLAPLAAALGAIGLVLTIVGGVMRTHAGPEEAQPIAALFVSLMGILAGALEWMMRP